MSTPILPCVKLLETRPWRKLPEGGSSCQDVKSWIEVGQDMKTKTGGRRDQDCDQAFSWTRFLVDCNLYCERHCEDRRRSCRLDPRVTFGWVTGPNWLLRGGGHQCTRWGKQEIQWTLTSEIFRNLWDLLPALSRDQVNWRSCHLATRTFSS